MTAILTVDQVTKQVEQLSPGDRLRLIQRVVATLIPDQTPDHPQPLMYGSFRSEHMSTDEDFILVEWRPTEQELNGF
ncbi:MAG TPA: hypothetical protein VL334_21980 [Anaerolineae bacterium]|nr:hypothetical protein [Anaerolineae bacterium]